MTASEGPVTALAQAPEGPRRFRETCEDQTQVPWGPTLVSKGPVLFFLGPLRFMGAHTGSWEPEGPHGDL